MQNKPITSTQAPLSEYNSKTSTWQALGAEAAAPTLWQSILDMFQGWSGTPKDEDLVLEKLNQLKIISYNVWFDAIAYEQRYRAQFEIFKQEQAHIICLQEVTQKYTKMLMQDEWICKHFYMTLDLSKNENIVPYGCVILFNKHYFNVKQAFYNTFPTKMARRLTSVALSLKQNDAFVFAISTAHLESLNNAKTRAEQMQISNTTLQPFEHALFMGDMNVIHNEDATIAQEFVNFTDVWPALYNSDTGYTFDKNRCKHAMHQNRIDRFLIKGTKQWQATSMRLLGTSKIDTVKEADVWPSDHFGIIVHINLL